MTRKLVSDWIGDRQGDGTCDTGNNNCGCDWDGGDCCDPSSSFEYCAGDELCTCLDVDAIDGCNVGCYYEKYAGDGFCDDLNNVCGCDWDGGDCCSGLLTYCKDCECRDPDAGDCHGVCAVEAWKGDLYVKVVSAVFAMSVCIGLAFTMLGSASFFGQLVVAHD